MEIIGADDSSFDETLCPAKNEVLIMEPVKEIVKVLNLIRGVNGIIPLIFLSPFDKNYRILFPALLLLFDDVSGL